MSEEEIVNIIAQAIKEEKGCIQDYHTGHARAAIAALDKAGMVIAPKTPTKEMLISISTNNPELSASAPIIYRAMISAWREKP